MVLVIYSGRPNVITDVLDDCDAVVAAFLPGTEADALAEVLCGHIPFTGKLSFGWAGDLSQVPRSEFMSCNQGWEIGFGLSYE